MFVVDLCTLEQTLGHSHKTDGFPALLDLAFLMAKEKKDRRQKTEKGSSNKLLRSGKGIRDKAGCSVDESVVLASMG